MSTYVATFYTHLSAQLSCKRLRSAGCEARGTCVRYEGEGAHRELLDADAEALYEVLGAEEYRLLWRDDTNP